MNTSNCGTAAVLVFLRTKHLVVYPACPPSPSEQLSTNHMLTRLLITAHTSVVTAHMLYYAMFRIVLYILCLFIDVKITLSPGPTVVLYMVGLVDRSQRNNTVSRSPVNLAGVDRG